MPPPSKKTRRRGHDQTKISPPSFQQHRWAPVCLDFCFGAIKKANWVLFCFFQQKSVHARELRGGEQWCLGIQPYVFINFNVQFSFPSLFHVVSRVLIKRYNAAIQPLYWTFYLSQVSNEAFVEGAKRPSVHTQCFEQFFWYIFFYVQYAIRVNVNPEISINKFLYISQ